MAAQSTNHSPDEPPTQFPPLDAATDLLAADQESLHGNVSRQRKRGHREVEVPGGCWLGGWTSANRTVVITTISTRL